jgi:hypothetical protein
VKQPVEKLTLTKESRYWFRHATMIDNKNQRSRALANEFPGDLWPRIADYA